MRTTQTDDSIHRGPEPSTRTDHEPRVDPVETTETRPRSKRERRNRRLAMAVITLLALMWVAAFVGRMFRDDGDQLHDPTYKTAAAAACTQLRPQLRPGVPVLTDKNVRADVIAANTVVLHRIVQALVAIQPNNESDRALVAKWLDDWKIHLSDREKFVDALRTRSENLVYNGAAPLGESITFRMDAFANRNDLDDCTTVDDLGPLLAH